MHRSSIDMCRYRCSSRFCSFRRTPLPCVPDLGGNTRKDALAFTVPDQRYRAEQEHTERHAGGDTGLDARTPWSTAMLGYIFIGAERRRAACVVTALDIEARILLRRPSSIIKVSA